MHHFCALNMHYGIMFEIKAVAAHDPRVMNMLILYNEVKYVSMWSRVHPGHTIGFAALAVRECGNIMPASFQPKIGVSNTDPKNYCTVDNTPPDPPILVLVLAPPLVPSP